MFNTLSLETLQRKVPSIFTTESAANTSDKYKHISTIDVVKGLISEGFMPVKAMQSRTRKIGKAPFTKHMLRFRHVGVLSEVPAIVSKVAKQHAFFVPMS
jgi:hypothetical protein